MYCGKCETKLGYNGHVFEPTIVTHWKSYASLKETDRSTVTDGCTARKYTVYRVAQTLHTKSYTDTYAETLVSGHIWGLVCEKTYIRAQIYFLNNIFSGTCS